MTVGFQWGKWSDLEIFFSSHLWRKSDCFMDWVPQSELCNYFIMTWFMTYLWRVLYFESVWQLHAIASFILKCEKTFQNAKKPDRSKTLPAWCGSSIPVACQWPDSRHLSFQSTFHACLHARWECCKGDQDVFKMVESSLGLVGGENRTEAVLYT